MPPFKLNSVLEKKCIFVYHVGNGETKPYAKGQRVVQIDKKRNLKRQYYEV